MTLLWCEGFDNRQVNDVSFWDAVALGNGDIISETYRRGDIGMGLRITHETNTSGTRTAWREKNIPGAPSELYIGFALNVNFSNHTNDSLRDWLYLRSSDGTSLLRARAFNDGGVIRNEWTGQWGTETEAGNLQFQSWAYVELRLKVDDTDGAFELKVNGATVISVSGIDTLGGSSESGIHLLRFETTAQGFVSGTTRRHRYYLDDVYVCSSDGAVNNTFLGDIVVRALPPVADGFHSDFTPSEGVDHFALLNDPTARTSKFVTSDTVGHRDSYELYDILPSTATVLGMSVEVFASKPDAGPNNLRTFVRSGGTDHDGPIRALSVAWARHTTIFEENPATDLQWTASDVIGSEFGFVVADE